MYLMTEGQTVESLRAVERAGRWSLVGSGPGGVDVVNDYLGYLADRGYSPRTVRAYAFDLLAFARWLVAEGVGGRRGHHAGAAAVLGVLSFGVDCRAGRAATCTRSAMAATVVTRRRRSTAGWRRSRGCSGIGRCGTERRPTRCRTGRRRAAGPPARLAVCWLICESPRQRSRLRVREPRRLPRGLDRKETTALLGSLRTERDRAIAGLMLLSGLRSAEVLGLTVRDVDIGRGWVRVIGKGDKERRVPLDPDVAGLIQTYLFAERPESDCDALFLVAKGPNRGKPLTRGGVAYYFPLPPDESRCAGGASARAAAHLRHRVGRGGGGPGGAAGVDGPRPCRLLGRLYPSVSGARARRLRCCPRSPARPLRGLPRGGRRHAVSSCCPVICARWPRGVRGIDSFLGAARAFLARWPDPQAWAEQPLPVRLSAGSAVRPLLTYLMLAGYLRPGYDYLLERKLPAILREATGQPAGRVTVTRFLSAATELGYSPTDRGRGWPARSRCGC